jgi:hypothetical protein
MLNSSKLLPVLILVIVPYECCAVELPCANDLTDRSFLWEKIRSNNWTDGDYMNPGGCMIVEGKKKIGSG